MLTLNQKKDITSLFESISKEEEFEMMFNNYKPDNILSLIDFMNVVKYIKYRSNEDKLELKEFVSLDIFYLDYRISIDGLENINNIMGLLYQRKNNNIFSIIVTQYLDKDGFKLIQKIKEKSNTIDIDNLDIRVRKSKEIETKNEDSIKMLSKLGQLEAEKITFRYKQRMSLELSEELHVDMTIVKASNNISNISTAIKNYEIEIDYTVCEKTNKACKPDKKVLEQMFIEVEKIKKVMTNSDNLINKDEEKEIINKYVNQLYGTSFDGANILYSMQPISAEVQHIVDNIPNKYSATDKTDGDKYQLYIHGDECYLISNNLHVKKMGVKNKELNNTIVEGELIYIDEKRIYLFMMFDCLYYKGEDIRGTIKLSDRLKYMVNISKSFNYEPFIIKDYEAKGAFKLEEMREYYSNNIKSFYTHLNTNINKMKPNQVLIYPKIFLYPSGGSSSEVFLFADIIWNNCTKNAHVECPYLLDGIIFTPLEQKYSRERKEQRYPIYKYKPPHTNSLDVFITFEKNKDTGGYMDIFDNSLPDKIENKTFRVVNVFVGDIVGGREQPIPFMKEDNNHIIYLPIIDENIRDVEGNIIMDSTVVEVVYTNDATMPHQYRWQVLKTRWDKTESVMRHNKRFGNNKDVAFKIWKSMIESVTIEEIANLSNPKSYDMQMKLLTSRLDSSIINSQKKQDIYYQKITNLLKKLREFHNWIKSILIYTYCSPTSNTMGGKIIRQSVLDIGCGRGGDILKMYHARVGDYVGIDVDFEGIYSATDGAISRYNHLKGKYPQFVKATFIQADGSVPLDSVSQTKAIPNLSKDNIKAIDKSFGTNQKSKFDVISSQMVIHYLFNNTTSIDNLVHNIKTFLKKDGFIILTLFDPDIIMPQFDESGKISAYYTDDDGKRNTLYEIIKKYSDDDKKNHSDSKVGLPIDVHMSWISEEGKYIEEYLVSKELMTNTMERAGCRLVDTDLFSNLFFLNKPYFENVIKYEENPQNKQFYEKVSQFYGDLKGADKESRNWSFMYRYYVFQKMD
jgi:SAM-dependent methyltransferase